MEHCTMNRFTLLLGAVGLSMLVACGGGGDGATPPPNASKLHYTNNPSATPGDWRLELDSGQDTAALRLKLVAPTGLVAKGASFFLSCDNVRSSWGSATAGSAFNLESAPQIFKGKAGATAADYQVGIYQKTATATLGTAPVALLTLSLKSGVQPGSASVAATSGKTGIYLDDSSTEQPITRILVGELRAE